MDGLIEHMRTPPLARLAGEAFCMIAGVQLARVGLEGKRPAGFESGPSEDPANDNVATDPDENLPWPDQDKIAAWWEKHEADFTPGMRTCWVNRSPRNGWSRSFATASGNVRRRHWNWPSAVPAHRCSRSAPLASASRSC